MRAGLIGALAIGVWLTWNVATAQLTQPRPGPGSGVLTVEGTVDVGRMPVVNVNAAQQGDWRVAVANTPTVIVAPMFFIKAGGRYQITWATGDRELIQAAAVESGGWVRVAGTPDRWVNLTSARAVAAAP